MLGMAPVKVAKRVVEYEDQLDETQMAMVKYAEDLAKLTHFTLRIVDLSKQGRIKRSLWRVFGGPLVAQTIVFPDAIFCRVMKG